MRRLLTCFIEIFNLTLGVIASLLLVAFIIGSLISGTIGVIGTLVALFCLTIALSLTRSCATDLREAWNKA